MVTLQGTSLPASHGFDLLPLHRSLPRTLPPRPQLPLQHQAVRHTAWIFPATVAAEGLWAFFGSLVLGLGQRGNPWLVPQAPWIWLAGAALIAASAAWLAWHAGQPA
jgi:hypothetical protein